MAINIEPSRPTRIWHEGIYPPDQEGTRYFTPTTMARSPRRLTASAWKPALARDPGTGKMENGCHSVALIAGQLTWMYAPTLKW